MWKAAGFITLLEVVGRMSSVCKVSFSGLYGSLRNARRGLKKSALHKGNEPNGEKEGRTSDWKIGPCLIIIWQRDVKPWLNLFITVYCYFLNLIFQCEKMKKKLNIPRGSFSF